MKIYCAHAHKQAFTCRSDAKKAKRGDKQLSIYKCNYCKYFHLHRKNRKKIY